jgi:excisionase family DNA binding protein
VNPRSFFLCICKTEACGHTGVVEHYPHPEPALEEEFWVRCPHCRQDMDVVRPAEEEEVQNLPKLIKWTRTGPTFYIENPVDPRADAYWALGYPPWNYEKRTALINVPLHGAGTTGSQQKAVDAADPEEIVFTEQVAEWLKMDEAKVRRLAREKIIPAFKVGKEWRFRRKDVEAWLDSQSGHVPPPASGRFPVNGHPSRKTCKPTPALPTDCSPIALRKAIKKMGR